MIDDAFDVEIDARSMRIAIAYHLRGNDRRIETTLSVESDSIIREGIELLEQPFYFRIASRRLRSTTVLILPCNLRKSIRRVH